MYFGMTLFTLPLTAWGSADLKKTKNVLYRFRVETTFSRMQTKVGECLFCLVYRPCKQFVLWSFNVFFWSYIFAFLQSWPQLCTLSVVWIFGAVCHFFLIGSSELSWLSVTSLSFFRYLLLVQFRLGYCRLGPRRRKRSASSLLLGRSFYITWNSLSQLVVNDIFVPFCWLV